MDRRQPPQESAPQDDEAPPPVNQEDDGGGDLDSEEEESDEDDDDAKGIDADCDEATREAISAHTRGAKRDGDANDRTDGGRPKITLFKTTGDLANNNEELDDGDIKDEGDLEDDGKTAPMGRAGIPPPPSLDCVVWLDGGVWFHRWQNPGENRTGQKRCQFFCREQPRGRITAGEQDRA